MKASEKIFVVVKWTVFKFQYHIHAVLRKKGRKICHLDALRSYKL